MSEQKWESIQIIDVVDGGRVWRNGGVVVAERRRRRENNGTADLWPPNGMSSRGCRAERREREPRDDRYAACAPGWIPDFHNTRRQPATVAGVRGRGRAQIHGVMQTTSSDRQMYTQKSVTPRRRMKLAVWNRVLNGLNGLGP